MFNLPIVGRGMNDKVQFFENMSRALMNDPAWENKEGFLTSEAKLVTSSPACCGSKNVTIAKSKAFCFSKDTQPGKHYVVQLVHKDGDNMNSTLKFKVEPERMA